MNTETRQQIFETICTDTAGPMTEKPFQISVGDKIYEFGTDGRIFLAFAVESSALPGIPATRNGDLERRVIEWLSRVPNKSIFGRSVDGMSFAEFLKIEMYHHCPACNGSGKRNAKLWRGEDSWYEMQDADPFEKDHYIRLDSHPIDANLIARTLAQLNWRREAEAIGYRNDWSAEKKTFQHTFYGEGWVLVVMGLREGDDYGDIPTWTAFQPIEAEVI